MPLHSLTWMLSMADGAALVWLVDCYRRERVDKVVLHISHRKQSFIRASMLDSKMLLI